MWLDVVEHDVDTKASTESPANAAYRKKFIFLQNVKGVIRRDGGPNSTTTLSPLPLPSCSESSSSGALSTDVECLVEVADDGSGQPQSDLGQLAGTQLAHGYESPQVGRPHQVGRESLDAPRNLPSDQRIMLTSHQLDSDG